MRKKDLKNIEELKKNRSFSKEAEDNVKSLIIGNFAVCVSIIILILTFVMNATLVEQSLAILVYNVSAIVFLIFNIIVFEVAYRKDSGRIGLCGVELLIISIFTLFSPYIFLKFKYEIFCYSLIAISTLYYLCKIILTCKSEKKKYLQEISDIKEIVKKESKDIRAVEETEKNIEEEKKAREEAKKEVLKPVINVVDEEIASNNSDIKAESKDEVKIEAKPKTNAKPTTRKRRTTTKTATKKTTTTRSRKKVDSIVEPIEETVQPVKKKTTTRKTSTKVIEKPAEEKKTTTRKSTTRKTTTAATKKTPVKTSRVTKTVENTETEPKTVVKKNTAKKTTTKRNVTKKTTKKGE